MCSRTGRPIHLAALATATALVAGCGGGAGRDEAAGTTLVAGFYPLEWTAERIGGERVTVASLTPPGAEPHDLELAPRDVGAIADADARGREMDHRARRDPPICT